MSSTSDSKPVYGVAVLLFPDADILDFAGPIEILSCATHNLDRDTFEPIFAVDTAGRAKDSPIKAGHGNLSIQPSIYIAQLLETLGRYHVLVVPGGPPKVMQSVIEMQDGLELEVIKAFANLAPPANGHERIILSVCTGAFLLGATGLLSGLKVTTHHSALDQLKMICNEDSAGHRSEKKTEVVGGQRFVDAGVVKDGVRIVTAGGVSSGLDAALHVVEIMRDPQTANFVSEMVEYQRRQV